jgi:flotillin
VFDNLNGLVVIGIVVAVVLVAIPAIVLAFLRDVPSGVIRIVSWMQGSTVIYRGPCKAKEVPLFTIGTEVPSSAINVDINITDQTADLGPDNIPAPIKVTVEASAIVSIGETDEMIQTAANRFFSKDEREQMSTLQDLLSSSGRRAINLLTHDQLFSAKATSKGLAIEPVARTGDDEDDDPLAIIIKRACSKELTDLGLTFKSLNIKSVLSEVAEARRRQSAAEANANANIVQAVQDRRAQEAALEAQRVISDKERVLAETRAQNAVLIARAERERQLALADQRAAELKATTVAGATAEAEIAVINAEAEGKAQAKKIIAVAEATAEGISKINAAVREGGETYLRYRQLELLPELAPGIAEALAQAKMITIAGGDGAGAPAQATSQISAVLQTVLAANILGTTGVIAPAGALRGVDNGGTAVTRG